MRYGPWRSCTARTVRTGRESGFGPAHLVGTQFADPAVNLRFTAPRSFEYGAERSRTSPARPGLRTDRPKAPVSESSREARTPLALLPRFFAHPYARLDTTNLRRDNREQSEHVGNSPDRAPDMFGEIMRRGLALRKNAMTQPSNAQPKGRPKFYVGAAPSRRMLSEEGDRLIGWHGCAEP